MFVITNSGLSGSANTISIDLSETDTVRSLYEDILRREADAAGLEAWIAALQSGTSVTAARNALINSAEASAVIDPLVRIYEAAFGRVPDEAGLSSWAAEFRGGKSFLEIAEGFTGSQEFANRYPEAGTGDLSGFITALYRNTLGREPETDGLNYWLNSGKSIGEILVGFSESQEFHNRSDAKVSLYLSAVAQNNTPDSSFSMFQLGSSEDLSGTAIDGKIAGAFVGIDVNGNGVIDLGEPTTSTDAQGNFAFQDGTAMGNLILTGGVDISTGLPFTGRMEAPSGSKVITPLTTLIKEIADQDTDATRSQEQKFAEAQVALKAALGLSAIEADLTQVDYIAESTEGDPEGQDGLSDAEAAQLYAASIQVLTIVAQGAAVITGSDNTVSDPDAATAVFNSLARSLGTIGQGEVDLASSTATDNDPTNDANDFLTGVIRGAIDDALDGENQSKAEALADSAAKIAASANREIEDAVGQLNAIDPLSPNFGEANTDTLVRIVQTQKLVQGEAADELEAAAGSSNPDQAADQLADSLGSADGSGIADDSLITGQNIGDVDGDGVDDDGNAGNDNPDGGLIDPITVPTPQPVNQAATFQFSNIQAAFSEDLDTSARVKVADISISDDGLGTNVLSLSGSDAGLFEIDGTALYLKKDTSLDFETNPALDVTVSIDDAGIGGSPDHSDSLTIQVTDANDAATVTGTATGSVTENKAGASSARADLNHTDPDANNNDDVWIAETINGTYGQLTIDAAGAWAFEFVKDDAQSAALNALGEGDQRTDVFTVRTEDGTQHRITITVNGANDAAVITGNANGSVTEDDANAQSASGDLDHTDVDNDDDVWTAATDMAGKFGNLSINSSGEWTYALAEIGAQADLLNELTAQQATGDTFTVTSGDGTEQQIHIGVTGANDAPTMAAGSGQASEDGQPVGIDLSALGNDVDTDNTGASLTYTVTGAPNEGQAVINGTTLSFSPGEDFQDLGEGQSRVVNVEVTAKDSHGATAVNTIAITVSGSNDAASVTGTAAGGVKEDDDTAGTATGNLNHTDVDGNNAGDTWVAAENMAGTFGSLSINAAGEWIYTLASQGEQAAAVDALNAKQQETETFTVRTEDGTQHQITVTVTGANDAAVITGAAAGAVTEDAAAAQITRGNLNHTDVDAGNQDDLWIAQDGVGGTYGNLSINTAGEWSYSLAETGPQAAAHDALAAGETQTDTFTVRTEDGTKQQVAVTVTGANDAARTSDVGASGVEDRGAVTVTLSGQDIDGQMTGFLINSLPENGILYSDAGLTARVTTGQTIVAANGTADLYFQPNQDFSGEASFNFAAIDEMRSVDQTPATATITIDPVNDAPVMTAHQVKATEDGTEITVDLGQLASDADRDALTFQIAGHPAEGSATIEGTTLTFNPGENFQDLAAGESRDVTVEVSAKDAELASVPADITITVEGVNDAPDTNAASGSGAEDGGAITVALSGTDVDDGVAGFRIATMPEGGKLYSDAGLSQEIGAGTTVPAIAGGANIFFVPDANFNGTPTFTYASVDAAGAVDAEPATATITVSAVDDAPSRPVDSSAEGTEDDQAIAGRVGGSADPEEDAISYGLVAGSVRIGGEAAGDDAVTVNADGSYSYNPAAHQGLGAGQSLDVTFKVAATAGGKTSEPADVTITVGGLNDAPDTNAASGSGAEDGGAITVALSGTDVDNSILAFSIKSLPEGGKLYSDPALTNELTVGRGVVATDNTANVFFVPDSNFSGSPTFTYASMDQNGFDPTPATATITVTAVDDAPSKPNDSTARGTEDGGAITGTISGSVDPEEAEVSYALVLGSVRIGGEPAEDNVVTVNPDGSYSFTPGVSFQELGAGETREVTFKATASDGGLESTAADVTITVEGVNDAPDTSAASGSGNEDGGAITISLSGTDIDDGIAGFVIKTVPDGGKLYADPLRQQELGVEAPVVAVGGTANVYFVPDADFSGEPTFTFAAVDASGAVDAEPATATISVSATNDAPSRPEDSAARGTEDGGTISGQVSGAVDPEEADVSYTLVAGSVRIGGEAAPDGTVTVNSDGTYSYNPEVHQDLAAGESREITFKVAPSDGELTGTPADVTITVEGLNDVPDTNAASATGAEDGGAITVALAGRDIDDGVAGFRIQTLPQGGKLYSDAALSQEISAGATVPAANSTVNVFFVPASDFNGEPTFSFAAVDASGALDAEPATATITVNPVDDAPVLRDGKALAQEDGEAVSINLTALAGDDAGTEGLSFQLAGQPAEGAAEIVGNTLTFNPGDGFQDLGQGETRDVAVNVTASDGGLNSAPATMTFSVAGQNDAPDTADASGEGAEDSGAITVTLSGSDVDGSVAAFVIQSLPESGTLFLDPGLTRPAGVGSRIPAATDTANAYFVPDVSYNGPAAFTFASIDNLGTVDQSVSTASITVTAVNDAPTGELSISGIAREDETLTVSNLLADADGLGEFSYQWQRDGNDIVDATGESYQLGQSDVGKAITVKASYTDQGGTLEMVTSQATANVDNVNDVPGGNLTISGNAEENQILSIVNTLTDEDGLGEVSYKWQRDGQDVDGATGETYELTQDDVGAEITVVASYTDGQGTAETITSSATSEVANINDEPIGTVSISGAAEEDKVLTASNNLTDGDGLGQISYQWQRGGVDIADATGETHLLTQADVGQTITVLASYTDQLGQEESVISNATVPVANVNDEPSGTVTITGAAEEGVTLTASHTLADEDGLGEISYQWQRDGEAIADATGDTHLLTQADVGKAISVVASYTDGQETAERVTSFPTDAVENVNDAPVTANAAASGEEDTASVAVSLSATDIDDAVASFKILTVPAGGKVYADEALQNQIGPDGTVTAENGGATVWFVPGANVDGEQTFTFAAIDASGAEDESPATATITLSSVSDAPSGTDSRITIAEDGTHVFTADDFGFSDPNDNPANDFAGITISSLPANGSLTLNNVAVNAGDFVTAQQIADGDLVFSPSENADGTDYASFTFQVRDDGSVGEGAASYSPGILATGWLPGEGAEGADNWGTMVSSPTFTSNQTAYVFSENPAGFRTDPDNQPNAIAAEGASYQLSLIAQGTTGYGSSLLTIKVFAGDTEIGSTTHMPPYLQAAQNNVTLTTSAVPPSENGNPLHVVITQASRALAVDDVQLRPIIEPGVLGANLLINSDFGPGSYFTGDNTDQSPNTITVDITDVSNAPTVSVAAAEGDEDTAISLTINPALTDPNETITAITISGIPAGAALSNTAGDQIAISDGSANLTEAQLAGLAITPPEDFSGSFDLSVTATSKDGDAEAATSEAETLAVSVSAVSDAPDITVEAASGERGSSIPLSLSAAVTDDSESITSIAISGIPEGATLSDGTNRFEPTPIERPNLLQNGDVGGTHYAGNPHLSIEEGGVFGVTPTGQHNWQNVDPTQVVSGWQVTNGGTIVAGANYLENRNNTPSVFVNSGGTLSSTQSVTGKVGESYQLRFEIGDTQLSSLRSIITDTSGGIATVEILSGNTVIATTDYTPVDRNHVIQGNEHIDQWPAPWESVELSTGPLTAEQAAQPLDIRVTVNGGTLFMDSFELKASGFNGTADVTGWNLNNLSITPPAGFDGAFDLTVSAASQDGAAEAATATETLSVTVSNGTPTLGAISVPDATDEEADAAAQDIAAVGGQLSVSDVNSGDTITASVNGTPALSWSGGTLEGAKSTALASALAVGKLTFGAPVTADGSDQSIGWTWDPSSADLDFLGEGETLTVTYQVEVSDGSAASQPQTLAFTINGSNDAPGGSVTISGTATEGQTLTASNDLTDKEGLGTITYQWQRGGKDIVGATEDTHQLTQADVGETITVVASYTDGSGNAETSTSDPTAPIEDVIVLPETADTSAEGLEDAASIAVALSGSDADDGVASFKILTVPDGGALYADDSLQTRISANGLVAAENGSATVYFKPDANFNGTPTFSFAAVDGSGGEDASPATATITVTSVSDEPVGGNRGVAVLEDRTVALTLNNFGFSDPNDTPGDDFVGVVISTLPLGSLELNGEAVSAGQFITVQDIDAGNLVYAPAENGFGAPYSTLTFQVRDNGSDTSPSGNQDSTPASLRIDVLGRNDAPDGTVTISGTARVGETLTASNTLTDVDGLGEISYQWQRVGADIQGATDPSYTLGGADVGSAITVVASYTDGGGTIESVSSLATEAVGHQAASPTGANLIANGGFEAERIADLDSLFDGSTETAEGNNRLDARDGNGSELTSVTGWTFHKEVAGENTGTVGINPHDGPFSGAGDGATADNGQVGYIVGNGQYIAQTVTVSATGNYFFSLEGGARGLGSTNELQVLFKRSNETDIVLDFDQDAVGQQNITFATANPTTVQSGPMELTAGDYEVRIVGQTDGDIGSWIDNVSLQVLGYPNNQAPVLSSGLQAAANTDGFTYNAANGHYYKFVSDPLDWAAAVNAADTEGGYLATITNAAERDFVLGLANQPTFTWLAGSDATVEENWQWVAGPETGQDFGGFQPWNLNKLPEGSDGQDYLLMFTGIDLTGTWNDYGPDPIHTFGYLVEIGGTAGTVSGTEDAGTITVDLATMVTDPNGDPLTYTVKSSPTIGTTSLNGSTLTFAPGSEFQHLDDGEAEHLDVHVTIADDKGASVDATVTVSVTGVNDAPTLGDIGTQPAIEKADDASAQDIDAKTGSLSVSDADLGDTLTASISGTPEISWSKGELGVDQAAELTAALVTDKLTFGAPVTSDGSSQAIGWTWDPGAADLDFLGQGGFLTVSYDVQVSDGTVSTDTQTLTFTINGTNTAPVASTAGEVPAGFAQNPDNGHYYKYFSDTKTWSEAVTAAEEAGGYLATITSQTELDFVMGLSGRPATVWLGGSDEAQENNWVWETGPEAGQAFGSFQPWHPTNKKDDTPGQNHLQLYSNSDTQAENGTWNDFFGGGVLGYLVEINGAEPGSSGTEDEDAITVNLSELVTDPDGDTLSFTVKSGPSSGSASINGATLTFNPGADFQHLQAGEDEDVNIIVEANDNRGGVVEATITVKVEGVNDAPTLADIEAPAEIGEEANASAQDIGAQTGNLTVRDVDTGDTISASVSGAPALAWSGGDLTSDQVTALTSALVTDKLSFGSNATADGDNQTIGWTWDPAAADLDFLAENETLTVTYQVEVSDGAATSSSQALTFTINGAEEAAFVLNQDTGHSYKYVSASKNWAEAQAEAEAAGGHLATITSDAERDFVLNDALFPNRPDRVWIGASDSRDDGNWEWVTGPEAGVAINSTPSSGYWDLREPNNSSNNEHHALMNTNGGNEGLWNDFPGTSSIEGYLIEISPRPADAVYNSATNTSYKYYTGTKNWDQAQEAAIAEGGYLATLTTQAEIDFVLNNLVVPADHDKVWIGASDRGTEGRWQWETGPELGQSINSTRSQFPWNAGEPNDGNNNRNEDYAYMFITGDDAGKWNDYRNEHEGGLGYLVEFG